MTPSWPRFSDRGNRRSGLGIPTSHRIRVQNHNYRMDFSGQLSENASMLGQMKRAEAPASVSALLVTGNAEVAARFAEALAGTGASAEDDVLPALTTVSTPEEGLDIVRTTPVDVVLLDLSEANGGLIDTIRLYHGTIRTVPLLVLAGIDDRDLAVRCIDAGAHDYLLLNDTPPVMLGRAVAYALARQREQQGSELLLALQRYEGLSSRGSETPVTRRMAFAGPVDSGALRQLKALEGHYDGLFSDYLDALVVRRDKPRRRMAEVITVLGDVGAGPRDLIDLHLASLNRVSRDASPSRARALTVEGRLLVLELMGLLVDYYRTGVRSPAP